jgi:hypothetical protein
MSKVKKAYYRCTICKKDITGVDKWIENLVFCVKCFRAVDKEVQQKKKEKLKNWYRSDMTDDEYYHSVFDLFC